MSVPAPDPVTAGPAPTAESSSPARSRWRAVAVENLAVVAVFAVVGAAAGWVWERWATPPEGLVADHLWNLGLTIESGTLDRDSDATAHAFGVVATFVAVSLVVGLVLGVLVGLLARRAELVSLAAVAAGSVLAAFLCYRVGLALGPGDPVAAALGADDGTMLPGDLSIDQLSPFVALPLAALLGLAMTYLLTVGAVAGAREAGRVDLTTPRPAHPGVHPDAGHDQDSPTR